MEKVLPKGWTLINLKEAVISVKGKKPAILNGEPFDHSLPYMDIFALERGEVRQFADIRSAKSFNNGAIAMVWDGARSGWVSKANYGAIGSTICAIYPKNFSSDYLFYFLLNEYPVINSNSRGVGIPHVDPTYLWNLKLPLPPLLEQNRIVAKLGLLFGQLERIKSRLTKIPAILKTFRQQVLTQAITGKLTDDWRQGKDLQISQNLRRLDPVFSTPSNWIFTDLKEVSLKFSYGTSSKSEDEGLVAVLRMGNLQNGKLNIVDLKYTSNKEEVEKYKLEYGDVLFNRTNSPELVGKTAIYKGEIPAIYAGYLIKIFNKKDVVDSDYLNFVLNSQYSKKWCKKVKSDGVSQSNINAQKLSAFKLPIPPLFEQEEIVCRVESLLDKADVIEEKYKNLKTKIENLPQAILHKAFKGELVEQLPTDGDAQDLLNEIKGLPAMAAEESAAYEKSKPKLKNRILNEPDLD
jgi:type I restriction enzyme, S subunit